MNKDYHTSVAISALEWNRCTHMPGAHDGLPCAVPGCCRGTEELVIQGDGGRRYRRRMVDQVRTIDGARVAVRVPVWFEI